MVYTVRYLHFLIEIPSNQLDMRRIMSEYSEDQILTVALGVIKQHQGVTTAEMIEKVNYALQPSGTDLVNNPSRNDSKISQKIRNLKSHGTLAKAGAVYNSSNGTWTI